MLRGGRLGKSDAWLSLELHCMSLCSAHETLSKQGFWMQKSMMDCTQLQDPIS